MIEFVCPHCNASLSIPEELSGQAGTCNKCGQSITAPTQATFIPDKMGVKAPRSWSGRETRLLVVLLVGVLGIVTVQWASMRGEALRKLNEPREGIESPAGYAPGRPSGEPAQVVVTPVPSYIILAKADISVSRAKRYRLRIEVSKESTRSQIEAIGEDIIRTYRKGEKINALALFFYYEGTDATGGYTAAKADWAPDGRWAEAVNVKAGDYSRHRLVYEFAKKPDFSPVPTVAGLNEAMQRRIFKQIVSLQDRGHDATASRQIVASEHGISVADVRKIEFSATKYVWPLE